MDTWFSPLAYLSHVALCHQHGRLASRHLSSPQANALAVCGPRTPTVRRHAGVSGFLAYQLAGGGGGTGSVAGQDVSDPPTQLLGASMLL